MSKKQPITKSEAISAMRKLSEQNIPFSFGFVACNTTNQSSQGYKVVDKALIRPGYRYDQSDRAETLIAYVDCSDTEEKNRQFHYALLMMFNDQIVLP